MQQSNEIMAAIMNNDKEAFKEFLCSDLQEEHPDLEREISIIQMKMMELTHYC